jgi:tetratricopeptide (TPR) repeat protein
MKTPMRSRWLAGALIVTAALAGCGNAQSRKAEYIRDGRQYYAAGNYGKARVEFSYAAQIDPKDAQVRFLLGQVAEKSGDEREAVGQYRAAITQDPKLPAARATLGRLYLYAGLPGKAMELVEPGLANDPRNAQLLTVRAAARQQLGDGTAALADAEAALQLAPDDSYAIALLASLYRQHSQMEKAIDVVQAGLRRLPQDIDLRVILADLYVTKQPQAAQAQLQQVVALEPKVLANRYRLARFFLLQKNADAAERTLRDAIAVAPDDVAAKLELVTLLSAQRGREPAAAQVDQFIAKEPGNDALKLALGQFLAQVGLTDPAEATFRAVIAHKGTKPEGLSARDRLAALLLARNDMARNDAKVAATLIDEVLKENARDNDALIMRGNMSLAHGDPAAAITDLRSVLRDQPNAVAVMRALARAYAQAGETDLAEETLRAAVQTAPKDAEGRLDLAQVLINANKLDQASPLLEELASEDPKNLAVQQALYRVQGMRKQYAAARATALNIQKSRPDLALGFYLAGMIDETDNRSADAERNYEQALKLQPDAGEPLVALTRLDAQLKQPAKAMQRVDAVIASNPRDGVARSLKADLFSSQGQLEAAIAAYQDAVKAAPAWPQAYQGLAQAQFAAKHDDDGLRTLQQGIDKAQAANSLMDELARQYVRLGRPDDTIALYDAALAKNPKSYFAANNLAMLLVTYKSDSASLARARLLADQIAAMSVADAIDTRGWVRFKSGDFRGAESLLQQAVAKAPDSPEMRYHLGMAQLRSGEAQTAEQSLEAALRSTHPFAGMEDARAVLARLKAPSAG